MSDTVNELAAAYVADALAEVQKVVALLNDADGCEFGKLSKLLDKAAEHADDAVRELEGAAKELSA